MADGKPILAEQVSDIHGEYRQEWYCDPPAEGAAYHVIRCTWAPDRSVRKIYEIRLGEAW